MVTCSKCGTENREDAKFCVNCGASLYSVKRREMREDVCFGEGKRGRDYLGLVSFGIFLIVIGVVFTVNSKALRVGMHWLNS